MQPSVFAAEPAASQETILFLGDSITAAGGYVRAIDAALTKQNPEDPNKYGYRTPYAYYDQVMETYATWLLTLNNQKDVWVIDL